MQTRRSFLHSLALAFVAAAVSLELVRETFPLLSDYAALLDRIFSKMITTKIVLCGPSFVKEVERWKKTGEEWV